MVCRETGRRLDFLNVGRVRHRRPLEEDLALPRADGEQPPVHLDRLLRGAGRIQDRPARRACLEPFLAQFLPAFAAHGGKAPDPCGLNGALAGGRRHFFFFAAIDFISDS